MKIVLRVIITLIALALIGIAILYFIGKSYNHQDEVSVTIDAPIEYVFTEFTDASNMSTWMNSESMAFKSIKSISGIKNEIGSTYELTFLDKKGDREFSMIETITDFQPNRKLAFNLDDPYFDFDMDISFKENNSQTTITEYQTGKGKMAFMNAMLKFMKGKSHQEKIEMYNRLKSMVETKYKSRSE